MRLRQANRPFRRRLVRAGGWLAGVLVVAGCAPVGPDYHRPAVSLPSTYPDEAVKREKVPLAGQDRWWTIYHDTQLDGLMQKALADNLDLQQAIARIEEADANMRIAGSAFLPEIDIGSTGSHSKVSTRNANSQFIPQAVQDKLHFALSTSFEIDFWGKFRRAREAARAEALGSRYARDTVELSMTSLIADTYFTLRSLDVQIAVTESTLKSRSETLDLVRKQLASGIATDLDVNQAVDSEAAAASQLKSLTQQRALAAHQIGLLTGHPGLMIAPSSGDVETLPAPPIPPVGLPSSLLARRPDVREAEQSLIAANAQIGVARAAMFPTISLTGNLGTESAELATLLASGSEIWSIGYGLTLPIFDGGRLKAATEIKVAQMKQALAAYQKSAQSAFREVADALTTAETAAAQEKDLATRVEANTNALRIAQARYRSGYSSFLEVLDAQRTLNEAQLAFINNRQTRLTANVDLIKALGGGWQ